MKKRLLFDVSTSVMFVGYAKDDELADFSIRIAKRDHAKYLVDRIEQVIKRNHLTIDDIDEIIIGIGPGSYTGLRIAVMVGKMLAYTKNIPLRTVSSLYFMTSGYEEKVAALIDARRGFVFSEVHDKDQILLEDGYRYLDDLSSIDVYKGSKTVFIDDRNFLVSAKLVYQKSVLVKNVHDLVPNYLRKTEAENNHDKKSRS
ncbi:tRNA (adenosine(37)-N6)-threonylcarbamoyltransferase complex dimerization subunit type 1 TsaB [Mariniplasma anaerobium]|uniref:tRNA (Adenosine(37)-N6)-threonylcarbamoyltransferase complex dimerization subunit type 1 TsaB n=1 Tax=Mariniplasma anaerobium TaxID=2735436 RepID=A0A7U9TH69_9MOLU|nr:tRNA (adenosine(37)-N6)-threonylcarbamoyltransferase complex dimerization subunit type 1 TsaB [Mariniplasma anaerobium]BCR35152.1 tRNA (adenosine(37)-N6)-threonylcarbamoyltransferase complex dimerization subunit type 1 TsaB [Mariniplasma anaerobium]